MGYRLFIQFPLGLMLLWFQSMVTNRQIRLSENQLLSNFGVICCWFGVRPGVFFRCVSVGFMWYHFFGLCSLSEGPVDVC